MKKLQKNDLKEGEIYKQLDYNYIFLYNKNETSNNFNDGTAISTTAPRYCKRWTANGFEKDIIEATPEEKHWLETCIKADQFVSYEEAMRTFIPEYVECIKTVTGITIGKILSVENNIIIDGTFNNYSIKANDIYNYFKPSTKEAYDAQFVVKEPEFVLPKRWAIIITNENKDIVNNYRKSIFNNTNISCNLNVNKDIQKVKQPLLTTEDGVDIFDGDKYFICTPSLSNCINNEGIISKFFKPNPNYKYFSTKEKAEEYILMNKPCLSLNDIEKVFKIRRTTHTALKELKELANTKING